MPPSTPAFLLESVHPTGITTEARFFILGCGVLLLIWTGYWFVRKRNGGLDMELDSMTLSRPVPTGFAWWGTKRTHDAVEKMLRDTKAAIESLDR